MFVSNLSTTCLNFALHLQDLVDGLVQLGVKANCTMGTGCPPVEIIAEGLPSGKVRVGTAPGALYCFCCLGVVLCSVMGCPPVAVIAEGLPSGKVRHRVACKGCC